MHKIFNLEEVAPLLFKIPKEVIDFLEDGNVMIRGGLRYFYYPFVVVTFASSPEKYTCAVGKIHGLTDFKGLPKDVLEMLKEELEHQLEGINKELCVKK